MFFRIRKANNFEEKETVQQDKDKLNKNRRSLRRNKKKKYNNELVFVGVNAAGVSSKLASFDDLLLKLRPSLWFMQETKMSNGGKIKTENSQKYEIFELVRETKAGGGIAIGALPDVNPVLISEGDDNVEVLVIEISASGLEIRCICGYGPQENHSLERKKSFWSRLSAEIEEAIDNEKAIILQMDGNLWAGPEVIKNDPHQCNANGQLLKDFLKMFPQLCVVNNLDMCEGIITRRRQTIKKLEESILDFYIVCEKILPFVKRMVIDEDQHYGLSNFSKVKGKHIVKKSDHNPVILELSLEYILKKHDRIETFNFRNKECQMKFYNSTSSTSSFTNCFQQAGSLAEQSQKWFKTLNKEFHKSFKKIRYTGRNKATKISEILDKRRNMLLKIKACKDDEKDNLEEELNKIENEVCELVSEQNYKKVVENFKHLGNKAGQIQQQGIWNIKRKLFPKNKESLPFAKKDCDGKIITSQHQMKALYLDTFLHRLRHRPINKDYIKLKNLKEQLFKRRMEYSMNNKSKMWDKDQLLKVLKALKNNKSRDPHGMVNELFKPGVIGDNLCKSVLMLFNKIKATMTIPRFMEYCNIIGIYKGKGEKMDLANDRGIFIVNIFRSILMKLIYGEKYEIVDHNMSDSNVGARKKKSIRNHIFILNGIMNEALQKKNAPVDIVIGDYRQCFDSLWLEDCTNDLFDAGIKDDNLALIFKMNSKNQVAVKTPFGITDRKQVERIVLQGEVFGPLQCSVSVDTFGKECMEEEKHLYMYRGVVGVPPLAMVDDVACPAVCGVDSVEVTAFINSKTNTKKLQFGVEKCHQLHVGNKESLCPDLQINNWGIEKKSEIMTGFENLSDVQVDDYKLEKVENEKYLGDVISADGTNTKNVISRQNKSYGINKQIGSMLREVCYGPYFFEVAMIYRESLLLSSILTNSEAWYKVTKQDIDTLEKCDESLLRMVPCTTTKCMLYLESGVRPIRFHIMARRLMFLWYILNEDDSSLILRFFKAQMTNPGKGDWINQVIEDLEYLEIYLTLEQLKASSLEQFRTLVEDSIDEKVFEYLIEDKNKKDKSKVSHLRYKNHSMQSYLKSRNISIQLKKFMFLRSRMLDQISFQILSFM